MPYGEVGALPDGRHRHRGKITEMHNLTMSTNYGSLTDGPSRLAAARRRRAPLQSVLHPADRSPPGDAAAQSLLAHRSPRPLRARQPRAHARDRPGAGAGTGRGLPEPDPAGLRAARSARARALQDRWPPECPGVDGAGAHRLRPARRRVAPRDRHPARPAARPRPAAPRGLDAPDRAAARRAAPAPAPALRRVPRSPSPAPPYGRGGASPP